VEHPKGLALIDSLSMLLGFFHENKQLASQKYAHRFNSRLSTLNNRRNP